MKSRLLLSLLVLAYRYEVKKALVISYYFPPCNIVGAQRAGSFADNFARHGLWPIIATRHWTGSERDTEGYESANAATLEVTETDTHTLIRMPYPEQLASSGARFVSETRPGKLALYFSLYARGTVNPKCNAHAAFGPILREYLRENHVDYILATAFPMNTIRLGSELAEEFGRPFIADFRDLWDNRLLSEAYRPEPAVAVQNRFYKHYLSKWLRGARLVTAVTQPVADEVMGLAPHAENMVVTNGYEEGLFAPLREKLLPPTEKFVFSVIGTLEPSLDISILLDGLSLFLSGKDLSSIKLNFIGAEVFPEIGKEIAGRLPASCTRVTERIPRAEAIEVTMRSHVLFHAGWRGFRGMASGKLFEYLGAHRNLLIAPGDRDVMERIVTETRAGRVAETPAEFAAILNSWFEEWRATGKVVYHGDPGTIRIYSRESQAGRMAEAILRL